MVMLETNDNHLMLTDRSYNIAKKLVQVFLPAISSLYFGLAAIWGFPAVEQVVGTLALITTFLGVCLGLSAQQYKASGAAYDGQLVVSDQADGPKVFSLELDADPYEIEQKDSVTFKVDSNPPGMP